MQTKVRPGWRTLVGLYIALAIAALLGYQLFKIYTGLVLEVGGAVLSAEAGRHLGDRDVRAPIVVRERTGDKYLLLGVPSGSRDNPYEWIILDATPSGIVMTHPGDGHFIVTCSYLAGLEQKVSINRPVQRFLSDRCQR